MLDKKIVGGGNLYRSLFQGQKLWLEDSSPFASFHCHIVKLAEMRVASGAMTLSLDAISSCCCCFGFLPYEAIKWVLLQQASK